MLRKPWLSLLAVMLLALVSCQQDPCPEAATPTPAPAKVEPSQPALPAILQSQLDAFNQHDVDALISNLDSNFVWYNITADDMKPEVKTIDQFRNNMISYFEAIPSVRAEVKGFNNTEDMISFTETVYWTTPKGQFTGTSMGVYHIRNGKIHRVWYYGVK